MSYINGIKFVGDLSLQDADILASYAIRAKSILEFGCGGSTQIFSQCKPLRLISVETDQNWIDVTERRLGKVYGSAVEFVHVTDSFADIPNYDFDLIFVDGVDHLRQKFAIETWKNLKSDGVMIFHDTRRQQDYYNASWVAFNYFNEIYQIDCNAKASCGNSSNMTVLHKKKLEPYVNWNLTEGKPSYAYGDPTYDGPLF